MYRTRIDSLSTHVRITTVSDSMLRYRLGELAGSRPVASLDKTKVGEEWFLAVKSLYKIETYRL